MPMYDCSIDVLAHHDEKITLLEADRRNMRERRNTNRKRLRDGLSKAKKPEPFEFKSQGSYAMRTMIQHPANDYDIDDGTYFGKEQLVGERGAEMTALQARQMVRDALDDGGFKTPPAVRKNCVRVYYSAGYHVDVPVYRRVTTKNWWGEETIHYELASSEWRRSDARDVTVWFEKENNDQSPDTTNGRQLRRIVRHIKKFARSRDSWAGSILSGFGITKLVTELYVSDVFREDKALYDTIKAIRDRLNWNLVVEHPCTNGDTITKGTDDPKAKFLRDKLSEAIKWLEPVFETGCTREKALKCWDKVFNTTFFSERLENEARAALAAPAVVSSTTLLSQTSSAAAAVSSAGGGRNA